MTGAAKTELAVILHCRGRETMIMAAKDLMKA